jgi:hypothetical protein
MFGFACCVREGDKTCFDDIIILGCDAMWTHSTYQ